MLHPSNNTIQLRLSKERCNICVTVVAQATVGDQDLAVRGAVDLDVLFPAQQTFPSKLTSQIKMLHGIISYTARGMCAQKEALIRTKIYLHVIVFIFSCLC